MEPCHPVSGACQCDPGFFGARCSQGNYNILKVGAILSQAGRIWFVLKYIIKMGTYIVGGMARYREKIFEIFLAQVKRELGLTSTVAFIWPETLKRSRRLS